jgi:large subunit ribosomal protein L29
MKPSEVRELSEKERQEKIRDYEEELFNLRFQMATGKIENPGRIRIIRRDVARLKTIQKELVATVEENAGEDKGEES